MLSRGRGSCDGRLPRLMGPLLLLSPDLAWGRPLPPKISLKPHTRSGCSWEVGAVTSGVGEEGGLPLAGWRISSHLSGGLTWGWPLLPLIPGSPFSRTYCPGGAVGCGGGGLLAGVWSLPLGSWWFRSHFPRSLAWGQPLLPQVAKHCFPDSLTTGSGQDVLRGRRQPPRQRRRGLSLASRSICSHLNICCPSFAGRPSPVYPSPGR